MDEFLENGCNQAAKANAVQARGSGQQWFSHTADYREVPKEPRWAFLLNYVRTFPSLLFAELLTTKYLFLKASIFLNHILGWMQVSLR